MDPELAKRIVRIVVFDYVCCGCPHSHQWLDDIPSVKKGKTEMKMPVAGHNASSHSMSGGKLLLVIVGCLMVLTFLS